VARFAAPGYRDRRYRFVVTKLKAAEYEKSLAGLHLELVKLQDWVKAQGLRVAVLFEGRDAAGKGGAIKRITSPPPRI